MKREANYQLWAVSVKREANYQLWTASVKREANYQLWAVLLRKRPIINCGPCLSYQATEI